MTDANNKPVTCDCISEVALSNTRFFITSSYAGMLISGRGLSATSPLEIDYSPAM
jgi:short subunit fatty acids transporter